MIDTNEVARLAREYHAKKEESERLTKQTTALEQTLRDINQRRTTVNGEISKAREALLNYLAPENLR